MIKRLNASRSGVCSNTHLGIWLCNSIVYCSISSCGYCKHSLTLVITQILHKVTWVPKGDHADTGEGVSCNPRRHHRNDRRGAWPQKPQLLWTLVKKTRNSSRPPESGRNVMKRSAGVAHLTGLHRLLFTAILLLSSRDVRLTGNVGNDIHWCGEEEDPEPPAAGGWCRRSSRNPAERTRLWETSQRESESHLGRVCGKWGNVVDKRRLVTKTKNFIWNKCFIVVKSSCYKGFNRLLVGLTKYGAAQTDRLLTMSYRESSGFVSLSRYSNVMRERICAAPK